MKVMKEKSKYIVLVGDGMADYAMEELGGRTPLEAAETPHMDRIAACRIGLAMEPGSDVANMSLLGYDPRKYHTGRGPLEAASMGVRLGPSEVAFRMNLVTLEMTNHEKIIMKSHSSGDISTGEAAIIVQSLKSEMSGPGIALYPGVAYRHLYVWDRGPESAETIPPHDVVEKNMAEYLNGDRENPVPQVIKSSWPVLKNHPVNTERRKKGKKEANSIWLWGQGRSPHMPSFRERFALSGGVISAVDLLKGIGVYLGFRSIHVEGATGYIDTNYEGKARDALEGLKELDFIFLHVEAPDEAGHAGDYEQKIKAIEYFDAKVVGNVLEGLKTFSDYRIMVISDHFTPIVRRTHTDDPTPFAWAGKHELESVQGGPGFTEKSARESGLFLEEGHDLMFSFIG